MTIRGWILNCFQFYVLKLHGILTMKCKFWKHYLNLNYLWCSLGINISDSSVGAFLKMCAWEDHLCMINNHMSMFFMRECLGRE